MVNDNEESSGGLEVHLSAIALKRNDKVKNIGQNFSIVRLREMKEK